MILSNFVLRKSCKAKKKRSISLNFAKLYDMKIVYKLHTRGGSMSQIALPGYVKVNVYFPYNHDPDCCTGKAHKNQNMALSQFEQMQWFWLSLPCTAKVRLFDRYIVYY